MCKYNSMYMYVNLFLYYRSKGDWRYAPNIRYVYERCSYFSPYVLYLHIHACTCTSFSECSNPTHTEGESFLNALTPQQRSHLCFGIGIKVQLFTIYICMCMYCMQCMHMYMKVQVYGTLHTLSSRKGRKERNPPQPQNMNKQSTQWIGHSGAQSWELGRWVKDLLWLTNISVEYLTS